MYKKFNKHYRGNNHRPSRIDYEKNITVSDASRPESATAIATLISYKSTKDLPRSGSSVTVKVDPYTSVLPDSYPYALLNGLNRPIGGRYGGDDNLDGGNTRQYVSSERSHFLHCFDSFSMSARANYRYLPIAADDAVRGGQYTTEMIRAISEVLGTMNATTYTNLAINNYDVDCSIPVGGYKAEAADILPSRDAPGLFQWLISYQVILQTIASAVTYINKNRLNMGAMMRMSWNRETPRLHSFFSLLKKKSFIAQVESLGYALSGEYFDSDWISQYNMISAMVGRRCDAMTEPLIEMQVTHQLPERFSLRVGDTTVFSMATVDTAVAANAARFGYTSTTFQGLIDELAELLSVNATLTWVRDPNSESDTVRFDRISGIFSMLTNVMNYFKPRMADLRTALDVIQRVGVNKWVNNYSMTIVADTDTNMYRNLTLEHLYQQIYGSSRTMTWNPITFRWSGHSLWNMYTGVPEYDSKSGGAFLSFSTKDLNYTTNAAVAVDYLPILLRHITTLRALNRLGTVVYLDRRTFDPSQLHTTARLVPLDGMNITMGAPRAREALNDNLDTSMLMSACMKLFGVFADGSNGDVHLEPDLLAFVTFEVEDLSNEMITYARSKGPFIVNNSGVVNQGFMGF